MTDTTVSYDPFRSGEIERTVPSTEPQREIISSALLGDTANIAFNEGMSIRFPYAVNPERLAAAFTEIVARHESLRATFTRTGDELCISDGAAFELHIDDQRALDDAGTEDYIQNIWQQLAATPMHLFDGPLFQATLILLPGDQAELVIGAHHAICDGWSFAVILEELTTLLSDASVTEPSNRFGDFAEQQHAEQLSNRDIDYWLSQYHNNVPELDLPTDRPRPAERSFAACRTDFSLDATTTAAVKVIARETRASVVQVVFAAVAALLHTLSDDEDFAIGLPVARQSTDGLHRMVGHAVQLLPIRMTVTASDSFSDLVARAKSAILDAQEHPNFTFGSLVRELGISGNTSRVPIVPVIFNIDQPLDEVKAEGHTLEVRSIPRLGENFEIFLNVMPAADTLTIEATHNTDLFDAATITAWLQALSGILMNAGQDTSVNMASLWRADSSAHEARLLSGPSVTIEHPVWIQRFLQHVQTRKTNTAALDRTSQVTFGELNDRAHTIASSLVASGVTPGAIVAHCLDRTTDLPAVILGIQLAGATVLPLDPNFPAERLSLMLTDAAAKLVLTDGSLPDSILDDELVVLTVKETLTAKRIDDSLPALDGSTSAYLIYTSGSTGKPKGVLVDHKALANFLQAMALQPGFSADDRLLAVTTASFDISLLELLLPLYCGGSVYVANRDQSTDARQLQTLIDEQAITMMQATPATWRLLLGARWSGSPELTALCGGEAMPADVAERLRPLVAKLWNMYGPTETTIWSSCKPIEPRQSTITIGPPIANTRFCIMDASGHPTPFGIPGELCIGGAGLATGYLGRPALTAERFVSLDDTRWYRTGDKARLLANGEVQFLGRFDDQVKVRGFRIELGDIENALQRFDAIENAAAYVWSVNANDHRIVACCVAHDNRALQTHQLRKFLRQRLPDYMIPQHFLTIEEIPLGPSGKINRRALPKPVAIQSSIGEFTPPKNAAERTIAEVWTALVQPERPVGRESRFFEIGGHSLLGLEAIYQIEQRLRVTLHPRVLYTEDVASIARQCVSAEALDDSGRPSRLAADDERMLSFGQLQILELTTDGHDEHFNLPSCFRLTGKLDPDKMADAVRTIVERHDAFGMLLDESGTAPLTDAANSDILPMLEHVHIADPANIVDHVQSVARQPTDLRNGPLARVQLISTDDQIHYLVFVPNQFAFDGWSFDIFLRELEAAYVADEPSSKENKDALGYQDFATWQRTQSIDQDLVTFWQTHTQQWVELPAWQPPSEDTQPQVAAASFALPLELTEKAEARAAKSHSKLSDVALTLFVEALASSAGQDTVTIDLATSGRYFPELFSIIGLFYQDLPVSITSGESFDDTLANTKARVSELSQHQAISRMQIEKAIGSKLPDPRISFSYQQATERPTRFGNLAFDQIDVPRTAMIRDLDFWLRRTPTGLFVQLDYRADRIASTSINALMSSIEERLTEFSRSQASVRATAIDNLFVRTSDKRTGLLSRLFSS